MRWACTFHAVSVNFIRVGYPMRTRFLMEYSLGPRGVYLALASIQCFIVVSKAPESPDSKSARCKDVTLGEIELFPFEKKKLKKK